MPAADAPTLIDTGPIVASLDKRDPYHTECVEAFRTLGPFAYTCWPVITEAVYLLGNYSEPTAKLFEILRSRTYRIIALTTSDLNGVEAILSKYADQGFQLADASLMYLAEREGIEQVLTIDRKDFSLYRTSTGKALTILPPL